MLIIPAIDIQGGCVVRLVQGNLCNKKIYSKDPVKTAKRWETQGAELIHIVDLDAATAGAPKNLEIVKEILREVSVPIELGGGVRDRETIKKLLDSGVYRVVLGTKAAEDSQFLKEAFEEFKEKIIVSIDAKDNRVLIKGWRESCASIDALALAKNLKDMGFKQLIYTDVSKDGTLKGPDIEAIKTLLKETGMSIIVSGGISSLQDIRRLNAMQKQGVTGIIVGKALYEGKFTLAQALKLSLGKEDKDA